MCMQLRVKPCISRSRQAAALVTLACRGARINRGRLPNDGGCPPSCQQPKCLHVTCCNVHVTAACFINSSGYWLVVDEGPSEVSAGTQRTTKQPPGSFFANEWGLKCACIKLLTHYRMPAFELGMLSTKVQASPTGPDFYPQAALMLVCFKTSSAGINCIVHLCWAGSIHSQRAYAGSVYFNASVHTLWQSRLIRSGSMTAG